MSIFHRILFAGDLSVGSRAAFRTAHSLTAGDGGHLYVLNVLEPVLMEGPSGAAHAARFPTFLPGDTPAHRKEVEREIREMYHADGTVAIDYLVRDGKAPDEIMRAADEVDADLIVMGTQGRTGVDRLICGSVAETVMRRSNRPVLTVREARAPQPDQPIKLILHPTDFSAHSWPALGVARTLARSTGARLVLLHVAAPEVFSGGTMHTAEDLSPEREALARLKEESAHIGPEGSVQTRFVQGDAGSEIVTTAEEMGCDLIVMGSHGRTGFRRLLMGSVAEAVMRAAPCLTMIVKDVPGPHGEGDHAEQHAAAESGTTA
ncbi:MAG: universal stress protein [Isosphaeraceae bacterium]